MADASEELLINDPTVFVAVWGTAAWSPLAEHVHCSNTWVGGTPPPRVWPATLTYFGHRGPEIFMVLCSYAFL